MKDLSASRASPKASFPSLATNYRRVEHDINAKERSISLPFDTRKRFEGKPINAKRQTKSSSQF